MDLTGFGPAERHDFTGLPDLSIRFVSLWLFASSLDLKLTNIE
jgi:hypothetical protein